MSNVQLCSQGNRFESFFNSIWNWYRCLNLLHRNYYNHTGFAVFSGSPSCPHWPAVHHAALNWGNGVMSASWLGLKSLITARFNGSHNPLLHPAGCWDDNGGRNTEALHQPWYNAIINYRGCQANDTHTLYLGNVSNEKNMFGYRKSFRLTHTSLYITKLVNNSTNSILQNDHKIKSTPR